MKGACVVKCAVCGMVGLALARSIAEPLCRSHNAIAHQGNKICEVIENTGPDFHEAKVPTQSPTVSSVNNYVTWTTTSGTGQIRSI